MFYKCDANFSVLLYSRLFMCLNLLMLIVLIILGSFVLKLTAGGPNYGLCCTELVVK